MQILITMKKTMPLQPTLAIALALALALAVLVPGGAAHAAKFTSAEISKKVNEVNLLLPDQTTRPGEVGSVVSGSTAVSTGSSSRAELSFPDESVVRLGSDSVFSFTTDGRDVNLDKGTLLMQSKKFRGKTQIKTAAVTAAITGTTILIEYIPAVFDAAGKLIKPGIIKIIVVEGSLEFSLVIDPRKKMRLGAGEMVVFSTEAKQLPQKFVIDLKRLTQTSKLFNGLGPLPKQGEVDRQVAAQQSDKKGSLLLAVSTAEPHFGDRGLPDVRNFVNAAPAPPPPLVMRIFRRAPANDPAPRPPGPVNPPPPDMCKDISGPPPPECPILPPNGKGGKGATIGKL